MRWDIFCAVIDNHGDLGVCWRLASDLVQRGHEVRLWVDDAAALAWMAPPPHTDQLTLLNWQSPPPETRAQVLIEAFGCHIPEHLLPGLLDTHTCWVNLEYLSAEAYVESFHGLPSPVMTGPGRGHTKHFFYPGFTPATGGLLRELGLQADQAAWDSRAWRHQQGLNPNHRLVSLFCYEPAPLGHQLRAWAQGTQPTQLLIMPGRPTQAVRAALPECPALQPGAPVQIRALSLSAQGYCAQPEFDRMLWTCDLNLVRGEDSLVRALWAGQACVWHIYPQDDGAHHDKLDAFLNWLDAPASLRQAHYAWNGLEDWAPWPVDWQDWTDCMRNARQRLLKQTDLCTQLLSFVTKTS